MIFCFPPHTTHESQPLHASVFKPLKSHWHEACTLLSNKIQENLSLNTYNFLKLLNTAWGKTMSPNIISSGFKRTGIYPFNPDAIDYGVAPDPVPEKDKPVTEVVSDEGKQTTVEEATMSSSEQQELSSYSSEEEPPANQFHQQFTSEQEALFSKRFDKNYDISDPVYLEWLKINHPEAYPDNSLLSDHFSFTLSDDLQVLDQFLVDNNSLGLVNSGINIVPHVVSTPTEREIPLDKPTTMNSESAFATESCLGPKSYVSECVEKPNSEKGSSTIDDACPGPSRLLSTSMSAIQNVLPPEHEGELNYISKYLVQYVPVKKPPPTGQRAAGARVLTSEECAQIIFEQEEKKKKQQQEKEARKAKCKIKKKEREEAAKNKAEQAAKRKEETARKREEAAKKKEEAAKKKEEAARKKLEKATGSTRQAFKQQKDALSSAAKRRRVNPDEHTETDPLDDEMQEILLEDNPVIHDQLESEGSKGS